jgi:hypothetical protein
MKRKLTTGIGMKKKLLPISAIVAILCLIPMFALWTSAQSSETMNLEINATGVSYGRGKGICLQASSGMIVATLPPEYEYIPEPKTIGGVTASFSYSYDESLPSPLLLDQYVMVHIHIDGSFRRLNDCDTANIILLEIVGYTSVDPDDPDGVQYSVYAYYGIPSSDVGDIGTVTKSGNIWEIDALIPASEQWTPSLCVDSDTDGFCIPLYGFDVVIKGTITN